MTNQDLLQYQKLIYYIANMFSNYPNKEDLYQVGYIGLIAAFHNFKNDKNTKFSTYAYTYIMGEMKKFVREDRTIKVSRDLLKLSLQIDKVRALLTQRLDRVPSLLEISNYLEIPYEIIALATNSNNPILSMDQSYTDEQDGNLYDIIEDKANDIDGHIMLTTALESLTQQERKLIQKRYMEDLTQSEVADLLGMSQVQVSRSEAKVLKKLKNKLTI